MLTLPVFAQQRATPRTRPKTEQLKNYLTVSQAYAQTQPDSAVHYANEGIKLAEQLNDREGLAALFVQLGYINALHHHAELARSFYNEALGRYRRLHDAAGIAHTYDQLGLLDGNPQDFSQALKYDRDSIGLAETYENMGRRLEEKGEYEKALSNYLHALTQYEHRNPKPEAYFALLENIGALYQKKGDSKTALHYLQEGIRNSETQGARDTEVHLVNAEGRIFAHDHNPLRALGLFKQALAEAKKYRQPDEQVEALIQIADVLKKQNAATCIRDLQQALQIARKLREPKLEARIFEAMAGVYRQQKNYGEAMAALDEQHHLLDSLLRANTAKDVAALDSSYVLERTLEKVGSLEQLNRLEKVSLNLGLVTLLVILLLAVLLWSYLRKIKRLNEELTNSNRVKDTLFSVIGHDLKGPAGSAAQLFELMETEDFTPDEMKAMIAELRKQTKISLELLQSLFEWGKAQLQGIQVRPSDFDPCPAVERCISFLSQQASQKHISVQLQLPDDLRVHADPDHFEFIVRNLLSNAIKFSHEDGLIEVSSKTADPNEIVLAIKDNGIGISREQQAAFLTGNLRVNFGTRQEKGSGLGLLLTKDFIKANQGRIWLESEESRGTTFYIAIPRGLSN
ncbi:ATP-binding protein [Mucilaginibacter sp. UR6-11]|uniref:ATP-binding protein n=1 Tax=Mucilaginibacter sp. UR6-11 TaxID=1435644 RepID=UPI001E3BAC33|nr:ATP-binding protein [Mucilaginibacter sp. UR6-11]MCC8426350.1 tetratricopeptide repeat protein [Mucilaginibacter sp. UR6-11]